MSHLYGDHQCSLYYVPQTPVVKKLGKGYNRYTIYLECSKCHTRILKHFRTLRDLEKFIEETEVLPVWPH